MTDKPDILQVIASRVELRRAGKEWLGPCPFHAERTPSFTVSESKQLFYCHGCHTGGDVFSFVQRLDGLSFPETLRALGAESSRRPAPTLTTKRKQAAELAAAWVNDQRNKFNVMIADAIEQRDLADEAGAFELAERFDRELIMLRGFYESLQHPAGAVELLAQRKSVEKITSGAEVAL